MEKSNIVPCNFACPYIANMGIITAEIENPISTQNHPSPALYPKKGGSIRFPAPKNKENNAKAITRVCLLCFKLRHLFR